MDVNPTPTPMPQKPKSSKPAPKGKKQKRDLKVRSIENPGSTSGYSM